MDNYIFKGKAIATEYEEYIDFINYVFGMNGHDNSFPKLIPKIYKEKYHPCESGYIVKEGDKIKAAVGAFPIPLIVEGFELKAYGIGNVAVHPNSRSKGYMKDLMKMAIDDIIADSADYMLLCGLRQRYNYFSFEICGQMIIFNVNKTNIRHIYGANDGDNPLTLVQVNESDDENIENIYDLYNEKKFHAVREYDKFFDTLLTWQSIPYIAYDNGRFAGYIVFNQEKNSVIEFATVSPDYISLVIRKCFDIAGQNDIAFNFPPFETEYITVFSKIAEKCSVVPADSFSVINYKRVLQALLKLKASYRSLCDGSLTLLIHGVGGDELLEITVAEGAVAVTDACKDADMELSHLEAMELLFSEISPLRNTISAAPASWLPLPLFNFSLDNV
ncbi:MAG: GNAT family N-acetyltransferase [Saccharofermentanales bacterium]